MPLGSDQVDLEHIAAPIQIDNVRQKINHKMHKACLKFKLMNDFKTVEARDYVCR